MSAQPDLHCPKCKHRYGDLDWHDAESGSCRSCRTDFSLHRFPALTRARPVARAQVATLAEDSTCFFHAENQAEKVCDGCGRFVCAVCAIPQGSSFHCPTCLANQINRSDSGVAQRTLFGSLALSLTILPLLIYFFTIITAPIALGVAVMGWNRPGSLVAGRQRWKMVVAGVFALAQIGAWTFVAAKAWLH